MNLTGLSRKKILAWTAVFFLSFTVLKLVLPTNTAADDGSQVNPVQFDLKDIKARGKLVVLTEYGPSTYYINKDQPNGYYYDFFTQWGKENHIQVEFIPVNSTRELFDKLINGTGDVVASYSFKDNRLGITYSNTLWSSKLMLVQKKDNDQLKDIGELNGKGIWVESNTNHIDWLKASMSKTGITTFINQLPENLPIDSMAVSIIQGKNDYLVTDREESSRLSELYPGLSVSTQLGPTLDVALAFRNNSNDLIESLNNFIVSKVEKKTLAQLYKKYFTPVNRTITNNKTQYDNSSSSLKLSPYDQIIMQQADRINWDWKLLAAVIWQESRFNARAVGAGGASGLMQLMPATARHFGATDVFDPMSNIQSGVAYIKVLNKMWLGIPDKEQRAKFILASYNIGQAHVLDAVRLAAKYGADPTIWDDNVELYLEKKMDRSFYTDPVVKYGYCNGGHACNYVESIFNKYQKFKSNS